MPSERDKASENPYESPREVTTNPVFTSRMYCGTLAFALSIPCFAISISLLATPTPFRFDSNCVGLLWLSGGLAFSVGAYIIFRSVTVWNATLMILIVLMAIAVFFVWSTTYVSLPENLR